MLKQTLAAVLAATVVTGTCSQAYAGVITTQQAMSAEARSAAEQDVRSALSRDEVRQAMHKLGVSPTDADARIASLSDAELMQVRQEIDRLPAGGDVIAVIGVVFLVLLILELVGVTNVFNRV